MRYGRSSALLLLALGIVNSVLWFLVGNTMRAHPGFLASAVLAWTFGLRHALDADHIAAIDLVTRRLMTRARRPVLVGLFFSLGHSSVVILVSLALLLSPAQTWLNQVHGTGGLVGTVVSILFLCVMAAWNLLTFRAQRHLPGDDAAAPFAMGVMARILAPVVNLVRCDVQMIPLGFLFGLGFDTASEIGLLGLATSKAMDLASSRIMLLPLLFTAGMALMDSLDTILMVRAWNWSRGSATRRAQYARAVTGLSAMTALGVAMIELAQLAGQYGMLPASMRDLATCAGEHFGAIGTGIVAAFLALWGAAALSRSSVKTGRASTSPLDRQ